MKRCFILLVLISTFCITSFGQSYTRTDLGIRCAVDGIGTEIRFLSPSIVRVLKWPEGNTFNRESLSVVMEPGKVDLSVRQKGDELVIKSKSLTVSVNLGNGKISFRTPLSALLLSEADNGSVFTEFSDAGRSTLSAYQAFVLGKDEAIYGLGQQQDGKMVRRNVTLNMIQGNTDDYVPFFLSVKGYGLFWDNYSPTVFKDTPEITSFKSDVGESIDYYVMYGGNADGVIACMRDLTGQVPMFPLWTFGYWQSRERYKSQDELVGVVRKYRELGVPLDGIIQDWQYWGNNYLWNAMEFLNSDFYNPQKMVDDVHGMNAHIIISVWNSFGPETRQYRELEKIEALLDFKTWPMSGSDKWPPIMDYPSGVKPYDPFNPEARQIYWKYLNKGLFSLGIDGWWIDSSEPDHMDFKPSDLDNKTYLGSFRKVRNAFPLMTTGGVYQNQRAVSSDKRVFILTRSAFAGQQRYATNVWSGDVTASWPALRNQISAGLNFSLTGIPYWNSDIGGFFLSRYSKRLDDAEYRELYARWMQFGAFCTMMRSHGADAPREIYQFGQKGDRVYDAIEKAIKLRYSLLPYIYSAAWDVTASKSTMMRALVMDFPGDRNALDIDDQYMFGKSLLVCPVTTSMYSKDTKEDFSSVGTRELYLPAGNDWYDFWTGSKHQGGQILKKETPLDIVPLYVRAGTILPIGPDVQYATEKKWDDLAIRLYPGADGSYTLYEDENDDYNYEKGSFSIITFTWNDARKTLTISDRKGSFPGMLPERKFKITIVERDKGAGTEIVKQWDKETIYDGKKTIIKL